VSKHRILRRVREALEKRKPVEHPGAFGSWRADGAPAPGSHGPLERFARTFEAAGGSVVRVADPEEARERMEALSAGLGGIAVGAGVPEAVLPDRPRLPPEEAPLGISLGRGAVAETGSLLLDARDGRRVQLLPPVHVVLVPAGTVHLTLGEALAALAPSLPSAVGLHSGPSKSADIGQVLVEGVHGPGRVVALVLKGEEGGAAGAEGRSAG
jgi:L-lactate dehydrogenase complex protein LldG